jgi:hypothetical protein
LWKCENEKAKESETMREVHLVNALGEDHAAEDVLQVGEGVGLDGGAEIVELLPATLVLLVDSLPLLSVAVVQNPWPTHPPLEWAPRHLEELGSLLPQP